MSDEVTPPDTAVLTAVYPAVIPYLPRFSTSLAAQTVRDFDLVVCNDGVADATIQAALPHIEPRQLQIVPVPPGSTPATVRQYGISFAVNRRYRNLVFADSDDTFAPNRLETAKETLLTEEIYVNELDIVTDDGVPLIPGYLSRRLGARARLRLTDICDKNALGLSNTAVRTEILAEISIPPEVIAVDWFLFTVLLAERDGRRRSALFSNETTTAYRQHSGNIAGVSAITDETIRRAVTVKSLHYSALVHAGLDRFARHARYFSQLHDAFVQETPRARRSTEVVRSHRIEYPLWWESTENPEE